MKKRKLDILIITAVIALLPGLSVGNPYQAPDKCECGDESEATVCATHVGGQSVDPLAGKAYLPIPIMVAHGWTTKLTYSGNHADQDERGDLGPLWENSEAMRLKYDAQEDAHKLFLRISALRKFCFKRADAESPWIAKSDEQGTRDLQLPWSVETSAVTQGDIIVYHDTGRSRVKYVFHGFTGTGPEGRLKSKTAGGEEVTFTYSGTTVEEVEDGLGRKIKYIYSGSQLQKIIEPHPEGKKNGEVSPLANEHGRLTLLLYGGAGLSSVNIGMPKSSDANHTNTDPEEDGLDDDDGDYYWRTTLFRYYVWVGNVDELAAVVYPEQYALARSQSPPVDLADAPLDEDDPEYEEGDPIVVDYAAIFYKYTAFPRKVEKETSRGAGCAGCGGGQAYEYPGTLSDLDPTTNNTFDNDENTRNRRSKEVRIKRPANGNVVEIVQVNEDGQLVARWTEVDDAGENSKQRLERRTYTTDGQLEKIYTYEVTGELYPSKVDPGPDFDILSTIGASHVRRYSYTSNKLTEIAISSDDSAWHIQVKFAYSDADFPLLVTKETRYADYYVDDQNPQEDDRVTDFTYDDQGRVIKTEYPQVTVNTSKAGGSNYKPTEWRGYVSRTDSRLAWTKDPEGIDTRYFYADNDGLDNDSDTVVDEPDGSEGFELTRVVVGQLGGLGLETRYEYTVVSGVWRRTSTIIDPDNLYRKTEYKYYDADWSAAEKNAGAFGNVIEETAPEEAVIKKTYDKVNRVTTVDSYDEDGTTRLAKTYSRYNRWGQVKETENWADAQGNVTYTTVNEYDSLGRVQYIWERVKNYTPGTQLPSSYDIFGNYAEYVYEGQTSLVKEMKQQAWTNTDPVTVATYVYDFMGRRTTATDGESHSTSYTYDYRGRTIIVDPPTSAYTQYTYDNLDRPTETKRYEDNAEGTLMAREKTLYDEAGRIYETQVINPSNSAQIIHTHFYRDKAGKLRLMKDDAANETEYIYDPAGRLYKTIDAEGNVTLLRLNAAAETVRTLLNHKLSAAPTWRKEVTFQYFDDNGRLTTVSGWGANDPGFTLREEFWKWDYPETEPSSSNSSRLVTQYAYDGLSRTTKVTDPDGTVTETEYDTLSRITKVTEDKGTGTINRVTTYVYDQKEAGTNDFYAQVTAENGSATDQITKYYYDDPDDASRLSSIKYPDNESVTYTYNDDGTVNTRVDQRNWTTTYSYDGLGRVTKEVVTGAGVQGTTQVDYSYDALGRLEQAKDNNGAGPDVTTDYTYTWSDTDKTRTLKEKHTIEDHGSYELISTYSNLGLRSHLVYPELVGGSESPRSLAFTYDKLHRLDTITQDSSTLADHQYKGLYLNRRGLGGALDSGDKLRFMLGSTSLYRDAWGRITKLRHNKTGTGDVVLHTYGYDYASNILYQEDHMMPAMDELYTYDTLHRLTGFERGNLNQAKTDTTETSRQQSWTLDHVGNWTQIDSDDDGNPGDPSHDRDHNQANQIENIDPLPTGGGDDFDLDWSAAGNLEILPDESDPTTKADRFFYDYRNRLIKIEHTDNYDAVDPPPTWLPVVEYSYDGLNRRVKKDLTSGTDLVHLYDGWQCIEEREDDGGTWEPRRQYIYGGSYIDELLIFDKDANDDGVCDDVRYYYCRQLNYNIVALTDADGTRVEKIKYDPYGEATVTQEPGKDATGNPYLFQGRRYDAETGLYYFRNRYYSPTLGRFLQRDPAGYGDGMNVYEFLRGRPVNRLDPLGEESLPEKCVVCCVRWVPLFDDRQITFQSMARKMPGERDWTAWEVCRNRIFAAFVLRTSHSGYCQTMRCRKYDKRWRVMGFSGRMSCAWAMRKSVPDVPLGKYKLVAQAATKTVGFLVGLSWCNETVCGDIELAEKHTSLTYTTRVLNPEYISQVMVAEAHTKKMQESPETYTNILESVEQSFR